MPNAGTYIFDAKREVQGKGYDGDTVAHALDYYFPEWRHRDGQRLFMAEGKTADGEDYVVFVPADRCCVMRIERISDAGPRHRALALEDPRLEIMNLWKTGDRFDITTDRRFLVMVEDFEGKAWRPA